MFQLSTPILPSRAITMTSVEIAEYTGKNKADVNRDIRIMLDQLEIDVSSFAEMYPDTYGRMQPGFALPKDLTLTLVSGYSAPMRHKIVCRWLELEAKVPAVGIPTNFKEAMLMAIESHEKLEAANLKITMDAPKVSLFDAVVGNKTQTISEMIREIEPRANQNMVRKDLMRLGYLFYKGGSTQVYSKYLGSMFKEGPVNTNGDRAIFALAAGKTEMVRLAEAGMFTMKGK